MGFASWVRRVTSTVGRGASGTARHRCYHPADDVREEPAWRSGVRRPLPRCSGSWGTTASEGINPDEGQLRALLASDAGGTAAIRQPLVVPCRGRSTRKGTSWLRRRTERRARPTAATGRWRSTTSQRRGGLLTLYNDVLQVLIGETRPWDQIAVMQYPDTNAFVDMIRDPDYQAALVHRDAGLADTAILVSRPLL